MANEINLHFTRPPKPRDLERLWPGAEIKMPRSCFMRMSKKTRKFMDDNGMQASIEKARGRPIALPIEKILEITELKKDDRTYRQIEEITGVPKSTCHYLLELAQRQKLKRDGKVVYV